MHVVAYWLFPGKSKLVAWDLHCEGAMCTTFRNGINLLIRKEHHSIYVGSLESVSILHIHKENVIFVVNGGPKNAALAHLK